VVILHGDGEMPTPLSLGLIQRKTFLAFLRSERKNARMSLSVYYLKGKPFTISSEMQKRISFE
jgi:hypothetical protein